MNKIMFILASLIVAVVPHTMAQGRMEPPTDKVERMRLVCPENVFYDDDRKEIVYLIGSLDHPVDPHFFRQRLNIKIAGVVDLQEWIVAHAPSIWKIPRGISRDLLAGPDARGSGAGNNQGNQIGLINECLQLVDTYAMVAQSIEITQTAEVVTRGKGLRLDAKIFIFDQRAKLNLDWNGSRESLRRDGGTLSLLFRGALPTDLPTISAASGPRDLPGFVRNGALEIQWSIPNSSWSRRQGQVQLRKKLGTVKCDRCEAMILAPLLVADERRVRLSPTEIEQAVRLADALYASGSRDSLQEARLRYNRVLVQNTVRVEAWLRRWDNQLARQISRDETTSTVGPTSSDLFIPTESDPAVAALLMQAYLHRAQIEMDYDWYGFPAHYVPSLTAAELKATYSEVLRQWKEMLTRLQQDQQQSQALSMQMQTANYDANLAVNHRTIRKRAVDIANSEGASALAQIRSLRVLLERRNLEIDRLRREEELMRLHPDLNLAISDAKRFYGTVLSTIGGANQTQGLANSLGARFVEKYAGGLGPYGLVAGAALGLLSARAESEQADELHRLREEQLRVEKQLSDLANKYQISDAFLRIKEDSESLNQAFARLEISQLQRSIAEVEGQSAELTLQAAQDRASALRSIMPIDVELEAAVERLRQELMRIGHQIVLRLEFETAVAQSSPDRSAMLEKLVNGVLGSSDSNATTFESHAREALNSLRMSSPRGQMLDGYQVDLDQRAKIVMWGPHSDNLARLRNGEVVGLEIPYSATEDMNISAPFMPRSHGLGRIVNFAILADFDTAPERANATCADEIFVKVRKVSPDEFLAPNTYQPMIFRFPNGGSPVDTIAASSPNEQNFTRPTTAAIDAWFASGRKPILFSERSPAGRWEVSVDPENKKYLDCLVSLRFLFRYQVPRIVR